MVVLAVADKNERRLARLCQAAYILKCSRCGTEGVAINRASPTYAAHYFTQRGWTVLTDGRIDPRALCPTCTDRERQ